MGQNTGSGVGVYDVSVAHHGEFCAVVREQLTRNGLLESLHAPDGAILRWVSQVLQIAATESADTSHDLATALAGRPCPDGDQGMTWILMNLT